MTKLLTISDLAERLSISTSLAYRVVAEKKLRAYRIGGAIRFSEEQIQEYLQSCEVQREPEQRRARLPRLKHLIV